MPKPPGLDQAIIAAQDRTLDSLRYARPPPGDWDNVDVPNAEVERYEAGTQIAPEPVDPVRERIRAELRAISNYTRLSQATGWLDSVRFNHDLKIKRDAARRAGLPYEGTRLGDFTKKRTHVRNKDLGLYLQQLRRAERSGKRKNPPDTNDLPEDPTRVPVIPRKTRPAPGTLSRQYRLLNDQLTDAQPLIREGLANANRCEVSSQHALPAAEVIRDFESDDPLGFRLMPHQRDGVGRIEYLCEKYKCFMLADDMGLGKTCTVIGVIVRAKQRAQADDYTPLSAIVAPSGLLSTWLKDLERAPSLRVGDMRSPAVTNLSEAEIRAKYDVMLIANNMVATQFAEAFTRFAQWHALKEGFNDYLINLLEAVKPKDWTGQFNMDRIDHVLWELQFDHLIVDEAHHIKNAETNLARGVRSLLADKIGILTGTPMQNGRQDLGALFRALRYSPFQQPGLYKACFLSKRTARNRTQETRRLHRLNDAALSAICSTVCIRRTKDQLFDGQRVLTVDYPEEHAHIVRLSEDTKEFQATTRVVWDKGFRRIYEALKQENRAAAEKMCPSEVSRNILAHMTRARLHLIHPKTLEARYGEPCDDVEDNDFDIDAAAIQVARHTLQEMNVEAELLRDAIDPDAGSRRGVQISTRGRKSAAQSIQQRRKEFLSQFYQEGNEHLWESDRVFAVVAYVHRILEEHRNEAEMIADAAERKRYRATHKVLIFCESLAGLDIIKVGLEISEEWGGKKVLTYDGTMTFAERDEARRTFQEEGKDFDNVNVEPDERSIMLISNGTVNEGPNLSNATEVFLVTPAWNPSIEDQAIGRADRMGQRNIVRVHRFFSKNCIESRVLEVQISKRNSTGLIVDNNFLNGKAYALRACCDDLVEMRRMLGQEHAKSAIDKGKLVLSESYSKRT